MGTKVFCDACGNDIDKGAIGIAIQIQPEDEGMEWGQHIIRSSTDELQEDCDFCSVKCLQKAIGGAVEKLRARRRAFEKELTEHLGKGENE